MDLETRLERCIATNQRRQRIVERLANELDAAIAQNEHLKKENIQLKQHIMRLEQRR